MFNFVPYLHLVAALGDNIDAARPQADVVQYYACAFGKTFTVRFHGKRATVVTPNHRYELTRRSFSLGPRYGSDTIAFAQDDDRAVLVGADDGPYRDCLEVSADPVNMAGTPQVSPALFATARHRVPATGSDADGGRASNVV